MEVCDGLRYRITAAAPLIRRTSRLPRAYRIEDGDDVAFVAAADGGARVRVALNCDLRRVQIVPVG